MTDRRLPVRGFEGLYEITSHGRVISLAKTWGSGFGRSQSKGETVMSPTPAGLGYPSVNLRRPGERVRRHYVHRLVAEHFLQRPDGKDQVNHIDGDKKNNRCENLEWCTQSENNLHAWRTGLNALPAPARARLAAQARERATLPPEAAQRIRDRHAAGERVRDILKDFTPFSYSYIWDVAKGKRRDSSITT